MRMGHLIIPISSYIIIRRRRCMHVQPIVVFFLALTFMGNSLNASDKNDVREPMAIDTIFNLPNSPLPSLSEGGDFAGGVVDVGGGLQLKLVSSFSKIVEADNLEATFFEPSPLPEGFSMLGSYAQPNNKPLFGSILVAKDSSGEILKPPTDYTLINLTNAYFWLPIPPDGYKALGYVVTNSSDKPNLDKIRCVRSDYSDELEIDEAIWGKKVYGTKPKVRGAYGQAIGVNSFAVVNGDDDDDQENDVALPISCLKNNNPNTSSSEVLEDQEQGVAALFLKYAPYIYFHPDEKYLPSSVNWFFANGALLYSLEGQVSRFEPIGVDGSNLPQGGSNDGQYWLDLPAAQEEQDRVKQGNLSSAEAYIHPKQVLGGTFTDIQVWVFYPFNGPSTARLGAINRIKLGNIGAHVGDWEHVTLRISNLDGRLYRVFFAQHSGGAWVDAPALEYAENSSRFVAYASLNGHANYHKEGSSLRGNASDAGVGLRDDAEKGSLVFDCGQSFVLLPADDAAAQPPWLNYARLWGPTKSDDLGDEVKKIRKSLPGLFKKPFDKLVNSLPAEVYGQQGPTGPKFKSSWYGDEKVV